MNGYGDEYEDDLLRAVAANRNLNGQPGAGLQRSRAAALRGQPLISTPSSGVETPQPQPGASPANPAMRGDEYRAQADVLREEAARVQPDFTQAREYARTREEGANRDLMLGMALQAKGGESFAPVGQHMLRRALMASEPEKFGGGLVAGGEFITDPAAMASGQKAVMEARAKVLESRASTADTREEREAARRAAEQLRRDIANQADTTRRALAESKGARLQRAGTTPSGELVTFNPDTGEQMVGGRAYTGPVMSQAALDKQAQTVQEALSAGNRLQNLDQMVAQFPNAFGGVASVSQLTPQIIAARWQTAKLSPEERQVRALVMQEAAQVINDLYGAAVSAGEMSRANSFVPTGLDDPATVAVKLQAAQRWAASKSQQYGSQVRGAAESRMGGGRGGPPPGAVQRID